ncbi:MAG: PaaI family thioesterase [Deltaproteobacteria bacterium]|jgi:acyl-coenzyme A thioesterase PaaI-like protein|nr:PaaI family thioesterase [Deltaproteobacteria bacterium]MBW2499810.1 PaaI family thioesterase [Deltaproteobacteria bacterium]
MSDKPIMDLETWQQDFIDTALGSTYMRWTGCELVRLEPGLAVIRVRPTEGIITPFGTVNGAVIGANLEFPAAFSLVSTLEKGQTPVTNDIFIQHLKGVPATAEILFEGRLLRRGRTMAWAESQATVDGKPHAIARITKTILSA